MIRLLGSLRKNHATQKTLAGLMSDLKNSLKEVTSDLGTQKGCAGVTYCTETGV